jgi:hypothetical protein
MRPRLLALTLLLAPGLAEAAWTSIGTVCNANSTTSNAAVTCTTSATAEAGNVVLLLGATDEASASGTDANTAECDTVTDSAGGNTWSKAREWMNAQAASAANGAIVCLWHSKLTNQIDSGGTITLNFAGGNRTSKAISAWEFTITGGNVVSVVAGTEASNDSADAGSLNLTTPNAQHLWARAIATESDSTTAITVTTDFTAFTQAVADAGAAATGMAVRGEFRIFTGTSNASDPTVPSADNASVYVALQEAAPPAIPVGGLLLLGVGL